MLVFIGKVIIKTHLKFLNYHKPNPPAKCDNAPHLNIKNVKICSFKFTLMSPPKQSIFYKTHPITAKFVAIYLIKMPTTNNQNFALNPTRTLRPGAVIGPALSAST